MLKKIDFKKLGKQFGKNAGIRFAQQRFSEEDYDEYGKKRGSIKKTANSAKNAAKDAAADMIKQIALKKAGAATLAGAKFLVCTVGYYLGLVLLIVVCAILILVPTAFAFMMFKGAFEEFTSLENMTSLRINFETWYLNPESQKALDKKSEAYEEYLLNRFTELNDLLIESKSKDDDDEDKLTPGDASDLKNAAVQWVYGKIYSDFFETSAIEQVKELFGSNPESSSAPILKKPLDTAMEIYSPVNGSNVHDAREEAFGDSINLYDLEAFDFVAGTLFDLLDLDMDVVLNNQIEQYKDEIESKTKEENLKIYQEQAGKLIDEAGGIFKNKSTFLIPAVLATEGIPSSNLSAFDLEQDTKAHTIHQFILDNFSFISGEELKWLSKSLTKIEESGCLKDYSKKEIGAKIIKKEGDFNKLVKAISELDNLYAQYAISVLEDDATDEQLVRLREGFEASDTFTTCANKYYKKANESVTETNTEVIKQFTDEETKAYLSEMIKELNLKRTQEAALTYREYLIALEKVTSVSYYSIDLKNSVFDELYKIPVYTPEFISKFANGKTFISDWWNTNVAVDKEIKNAANLFERIPSLNTNYFIDKNKSPILIGIDENTKENYFTGYQSQFISEIIDFIGNPENPTANTESIFYKLQSMKELFKAAESGDKEAQATVGSEAWDELYEVGMDWANNEYFQYYFKGLYEYDEKHTPKTYRTFINNLKERKYTNSGVWENIIYEETTGHGGIPDYSGFDDAQAMDGILLSFTDYYNEQHGTSYEATDKKIQSIFKSYETSRNNFIEKWDVVRVINGDVTIRRKETDFYEKAFKFIDSEISRLSTLVNDLKYIAEVSMDNAPSGLFVESDLSTIRKGDTIQYGNNPEFIQGNVLMIKNFKYTQEEAIKAVARTHYSDVLAKYKSGSSTFGSIVLDWSGFELGSWTVPGSENYGSYAKAAEYLPLVQQIVAENGNCIDPHLIIAMIAAESSGNMDPPDSPTAAGLTQIEDVHWYNTVILPNGKAITLDPEKLKVDARLAIEAGIWQAFERAEKFQGNILMGIVGYNMGPNAMDRIMFLTLVGKGELSMSDWTGKGSTAPKKIQPILKEYAASGDMEWVNYRQAYQEEKWFGSAVGTLNHLEKVLAYYNPTEYGSPWVGSPENAVGMGSSSIQGDESSPYHVSGKLLLWQEYYTEEGVFANLDKWAKSELEKANKKSKKLFSKTVIDAINGLSTDLQDELVSVGISQQEFKAIIAATLNAGTEVVVDGKVLVCEPGFKMSPLNTKEVKTIIKEVAKKYIKIFEQINGKDRDFAVYLYTATDYDLTLMEVKAYNGSFNNFIKDKLQNDAESFTDVSTHLRKVAQILSGDLSVNVDDFYSVLSTITTDESSDGDNSVIQNPIDLFYEEWLEAKYAMHETYNNMIEEVNAQRVAEGKEPYELLPIAPNSGVDNSYSSNIEGSLTIEGPNGVYYSFRIEKKMLTNIDTSKSLSSTDYIVIHDIGSTGPLDTALNQYEKMNSENPSETMHYVVGPEAAYHFIENTVAANHINDSDSSSGGTMPQVTNSNSLGVQFSVATVENTNRTFWYTVALTKYLMESYGISIDNVVLHNDVTGVNDSAFMLANDRAKWNEFKEALANSTVRFEQFTGGLAPSDVALAVVEKAMEQLGKPYGWGATGPDSFDCSGLVQYAYANNSIKSISIPRTTYDQVKAGTLIYEKSKDGTFDTSILLPGDLIFRNVSSNGPEHVLMWVGNGQAIHAPQTGDVVKLTSHLGDVSHVVRIVEAVSGGGSIPFFSQKDSRWANFTYYKPGKTIRGSGCGVTSMAMLINGLNADITAFDTNKDGVVTPDEMAVFSMNKGTFVDGVGTDGAGLASAVAKASGLTYYGTTSSLDELKEHLRQGHVALGSYSKGLWTNGGHIIAVVGIDSSGKPIVYDPAIETLNGSASYTGTTRYNGPQSDANMRSGLNCFIIIGK